MNAWWQARSSRQKSLIAAGCTGLLAALIWLFALAPAIRGLEQARLANQEAREQLVQLQRLDALPDAQDQFYLEARRLAEAAGLTEGELVQTGPEEISARFRVTSTSQFLAWTARLEARLGLEVVAAELSQQDEGADVMTARLVRRAGP